MFELLIFLPWPFWVLGLQACTVSGLWSAVDWNSRQAFCQLSFTSLVHGYDEPFLVLATSEGHLHTRSVLLLWLPSLVLLKLTWCVCVELQSHLAWRFASPRDLRRGKLGLVGDSSAVKSAYCSLLEDSSSGLSTHIKLFTTACNSISRASNTVFWSPRILSCGTHLCVEVRG